MGGGIGASDTLGHLDSSDDLLTQKVTDLNYGVVHAGHHVDGKMSIHGTHLVQVSLGHADNHVLNVRAHGTDGGEFLSDTEPLLHSNLLLAEQPNVELLLELAGEHTTWAFNTDLAVLNRDLDCWWKNKYLESRRIKIQNLKHKPPAGMVTI